MKKLQTYTFTVSPNSADNLTPDEKKMVIYYRGSICTNKSSPTYGQMAKLLNIKKWQVNKMLTNLKKKGFDLRREGNLTLYHHEVQITFTQIANKPTPQKTSVEMLEEILKTDPRKGAFIYHDLFNNRKKHGFTFDSNSRIYEIATQLVKSGKAQIINLYNPNTKNENKMQQYIQLTKL